MASNEPERLPSARNGRIAIALTRSGFLPRTLSLAASPSRPRQRLGGRCDLSRGCPACLAAPRAEHGKDASHQFLQPTHDTSTLRPARFPVAPPSNLARWALRHTPRDPPVSAVRPRPKPPADPSGASLDGEPPASASSRLVGVPCGAPRGHRSFLAELRSTAPPTDAAGMRFYRPRSRLVTRPLTLSVAPVPPGKPGFAGSQIHVRRRLVKDNAFCGSERLPSTNTLSSPLSRRVMKSPQSGCHRVTV